jgi:hypothetical protein
MALSITRQVWNGKDQPTSTRDYFGPEVGSVVRFSCQPYHYGTMEVLSVEVIGEEGSPMGRRFEITGRALAGSTTTSRLFGASSARSCEGQEFTLYCWSAASDGGWDYVYPV